MDSYAIGFWLVGIVVLDVVVVRCSVFLTLGLWVMLWMVMVKLGFIGF